MSLENTEGFTKDNLDFYLNELAKQYRKLYKPKEPVELILVGGAAVLAGYDFRRMTQDMDALSSSMSSIRDAARIVAEKYNLPADWLNSDFTNTASYSPKISAHSKYYRTFSHAIAFRIVSEEYLVAMKLMAGRKYKNDFSDIAGILQKHETAGNPINREDVIRAAEELYGSWKAIPEENREYFENVILEEHTESAYNAQREKEKSVKNRLVRFESDYPGVLNGDNAAEIMAALDRLLDDSEEDSEKGKKNEYHGK